MVTRNLHFRLQEYCDCYVDSDLKAELEKFVSGSRDSVDEDATEAALKALALVLLEAIEQEAERICISPKHISLASCERGMLATFSPDLTARVREIVGEISGVGEEKEKGRISLGLRGADLDLSVQHHCTNDKAGLIIGLPEL
ncbi:MAG: hypothetical protein GXP25_01360 [Planctomycetes bacterium]|nr:hypothetical protein [Planctomycetota bacterium]